jgi:hypothetical protein
MNEHFAGSRAALEGQRREAVPVGPKSCARPQSGDRLAGRAATGISACSPPARLHRPMLSRRSQGRRVDPASLLLRTILKHLGLSGMAVTREHHRPWASITFSGERHEWALTLSSAGADDAIILHRIAQLGELEMDVPGHLLVDISGSLHSEGADRLIRIEALTVESD